jgi:hypothetical protein
MIRFLNFTRTSSSVPAPQRHDALTWGNVARVLRKPPEFTGNPLAADPAARRIAS